MRLGVARRLGRISNLPTVWSDALAGMALAGGLPRPAALVCLIAGFSLSYVAGMFLNDAFDAQFDRRLRPERPIPAGEASRREVFGYGFGGLAGGLALTVAGARLGQGGAPAVVSAAALAGAIVIYDAWHKTNPAGPAIMGLCRALIYLTAALAVSGTLGGAPAAAAFAFLYLIGLTYAAKQETAGRVADLWPLALLLSPLACAAAHRGGGALEAAICGALTLAVARAWTWLKRPAPVFGAAIGLLIAALSLVDALFLSAAGAGALAGVAVLCFLATLGLQRWTPGT